MGSLVAGSKAVLLKGTKPETILKAVSDEECTIVWLLVPWAQDILDALDRGDIKLSDYRLDQWRLMHIGAQRFHLHLSRDGRNTSLSTSTIPTTDFQNQQVRAVYILVLRISIRLVPSEFRVTDGNVR